MAESLTTPEQREALEKAGWRLFIPALSGDPTEQWCKGTEDVFAYHQDGGLTFQCDAKEGFAVASILGISPSQQVPDGYVLLTKEQQHRIASIKERLDIAGPVRTTGNPGPFDWYALDVGWLVQQLETVAGRNTNSTPCPDTSDRVRGDRE